MGRKVHPIGFRLGVIRDWQAKWYASKHYVEFLREDLRLRKAIQSKYNEAGVSLVEIERQANMVSITIHTSRPGVVIGRGGQRVDETRHYLEDLIGKRIQLNIQEIRQPELDAYLVAKSVAEQIGRRISYRRAMKQAMFRTIQAGAKGIRIRCAGRLGGAEIARRQVMHQGQVPLHTLRADIDYGFTEAHTTLGRIGVKVWINKGEILPEPKEQEAEEALPAPIELKEEPTELVAAPAEPVEKPAEPVAAESGKVAPEVKLEEKPAKPTRKRKKAATTAEPVAAESGKVAPEVKLEEKPAKPTRKRKKAATTAEPVAAESGKVAPEVKLEEKPAKPTRKRKKAAKAEASTITEKEEKDVTTQAGEISQES